ncbi:MAG: cob(I)yrinic acid a,c-diamide adenosyltransferase [Deferribacteraceae bacterium]|jgi:cob(I)alamin adenosyltransferase|nr:cob(I)yrinic acid a,c-diamide adenosyltransferase [Deferribacteraceae bacterium]
MFEKGYIQIYTGSGKGKTTAAIGVAIRAAGNGMRVFFGQFLKHRPSSEHRIFADYPNNIKLLQFGTDQFVIGKPSKLDIDCAQGGLSLSQKAIQSGYYDLAVLDELNVAVNLGLIELESVIELLKTKPEHVEIIITGRDAPQELIDIAHLVSEVREVKHYYKIGVQARAGVEE